MPLNSEEAAFQSCPNRLTPSAKAQHNPFLLARRSNHSLSGELAKRPSSRACEWFATNTVMHSTATAMVSRYLVVTTTSRGAAYALGRIAMDSFTVRGHP